MSRHGGTTYGVFVLEREEWHQISEHWQLPHAVERARETHEILGVRTRVRSSVGIVIMELQEQCSPLRVRYSKGKTQSATTPLIGTMNDREPAEWLGRAGSDG